MGAERILVLLAVLLIAASGAPRAESNSKPKRGTWHGFYARSCPQAESIVRATVRRHFRAKPDNAPGLLRMFFHDCFVHGCDGSILLDGTSTEKTAAPNIFLRGFDVIEDAKSRIEAACPGVVSCADILAFAVRDSVVLTKGPTWDVRGGRRDGRVSSANNTANLPSFSDSVAVQKRKFLAKGLNTLDLVALVGGHTIGTSQCRFFNGRLSNFTATGGPDPSLDPALLRHLRSFCRGNVSRRADLDVGSGARFDRSFFNNLMKSKGILQSDQVLWADRSTRRFIQGFSGARRFPELNFNLQFANSMIKMGDVDVKTGNQGEIRRVCSRLN